MYSFIKGFRMFIDSLEFLFLMGNELLKFFFKLFFSFVIAPSKSTTTTAISSRSRLIDYKIESSSHITSI